MNELIRQNGEEIVRLYKEAYNQLTGTNICDSADILYWRYRNKIALLSDYKVGIEKETNNSNIARGTYTIYLMAEPDILEFLQQYMEDENEND